MIELYIKSLEQQIDDLKSLGCSNELIIKKLKRKYKSKTFNKQTKNMNEIIAFLLFNKKIHIDGREIKFSKEI